MIFDLWSIHMQIRACREHRHAICIWLHIQTWNNHVSLRDFAPCFNLGGSGCSAWAVHAWETSESCSVLQMKRCFNPFRTYDSPLLFAQKPETSWNEKRFALAQVPQILCFFILCNYFHYLVFLCFMGGPGVYVVVTSTKPAPGCEETQRGRGI